MPYLPIDIQSAIRKQGLGSVGDGAWITPYDAYRFVSFDIPTRMASAVGDEERWLVRVAVQSQLADAVLDVMRVARLAYDLHRFHVNDVTPTFDAVAWPVLAYMWDGETTAAIDYMPVIHFARRGAVASMKRMRHALRRRYKSWGQKGVAVDIQSLNELMAEYIGKSNASVVQTYPFNQESPAYETPVPEVAAVVDKVQAVIEQTCPMSLRDDKVIFPSFRLVLRRYLQVHFGQAYLDAAALQSRRVDRDMGRALLTGSPKPHGRLLSAFYMREGRDVIRFSHGGERGLFVDHVWGLSELVGCTQYYLHGRGEAELIEPRVKSGQIVTLAEMKDVSFETLGSDRHLAMRKGQQTWAKSRNGKTVMYVVSAYTSESKTAPPSFKIPDVLLFDFQRWLLRTLKEAGFRVVVKAHPKGVQQEDFPHRQYCDEVRTSQFGPDIMRDIDCQIYDFAGTAFMDAMAYPCGIVFLDHGVRPIDPSGENILFDRVKRVDCLLGEDNVFRAPVEKLISAIDEASVDTDDSRFESVDEYFSP